MLVVMIVLGSKFQMTALMMNFSTDDFFCEIISILFVFCIKTFEKFGFF